jgi:sorbitol-specific phosphotransferase system component IIA
VRRYFNFSKTAGVNTAVAENKLIDANASFPSGTYPVVPGDVVVNENTMQEARVISVSITELTLDSHIFTAVGQRYRVRAGYVLKTGTTTGVSPFKLIDNNANFLQSGVQSGYIVRIGDEYAVITAVDSTTQLSLSRHIATRVGLSYEVYPGEWVYVESVQDLIGQNPLPFAADSTEVSTALEAVLKEFPFFYSETAGIKPREFVVLMECKGVGTLKVLINSVEKASIDISSSSYQIKIATIPLGLSGDVVATFAVKGVPNSGQTVSLRLLEVYSRR